MKNILKIILALNFLVLLAASTYAIEYQSLGGRPAYPDPAIPRSVSWFIYNLNKGEKKEDAVEVINNYETTLDVLVYAADGIRSSSGGFAIKQFSESKEAVGAWVKFYPDDPPEVFKKLFEQREKSILKFCSTDIKNDYTQKDISDFETWCEGKEVVQLNVKSMGKVLIPFVFSVPEEIDVGEHTGGVVIQKAQTETTQTSPSQGITLTTRVGVRIYQTVPGDIVKELKIESFTVTKNWKDLDFNQLFKRQEQKPENFTVHTEIENSGNVSVDFSETLEISDDLFNKYGEKITERNFQILRGDTFSSLYDWNNPRFGKFTFSTNVMYTDNNNLVKSVNSDNITIWVIPWRESIIATTIMLLLGIPLIIIKRNRKKKYGGKGWTTYIVREKETLADILEKYNVSWRVFVKTNKIKAPYILKTGERVLVPPKKD